MEIFSVVLKSIKRVEKYNKKAPVKELFLIYMDPILYPCEVTPISSSSW